MDLDTRIRANIVRHPEWPDWRHAKNLKCSSDDVRRVRGSPQQCDCARPEPRAPALPHDGHQLGELRERYDHSLTIPRRIRDVIASHILGGKWLHDWEMREIVGANSARWRRYADQFPEYQTTIDGKVIWLDPAIKADVERMKAT